jgi:hypothetical protein
MLTSWETNKESFSGHVENVKSIVPKACDKILIIKLLYSFLSMGHRSQLLVKAAEDTTRIEWLSN